MADNNGSDKGNESQITLTGPEFKAVGQAPVIFVNHASVSTSPDEMVMEFGTRLPNSPTIASMSVTLVMTVVHAKLLMLAIQNQLKEYESSFGPVEADLVKRLNPEVLHRLGIPGE